jgi:hypothetical protein
LSVGPPHREDQKMKTGLACAVAFAVSTPAALWAEDVDLDQLRTALEKYQDVNVALADGYIPDPSGCA